MKIVAQILIGSLALLPLTNHAANPPKPVPISHPTLWSLKQVGSPAPSPDGRWIVVPVSEPAYDEKNEVSDLWLVATDGSEPPKRFTTAKGSESNPAWNPDSDRIAFTAKRNGESAPQVYVIALDGGEARRLTHLSAGARNPQWSRDGKLIAFQSSVLNGATNEASNLQVSEERKKSKTKVRTYESFPIRNWDRWVEPSSTHLFVVPADGSRPEQDLLAGTALANSPGFGGARGEGAMDDLQPAWTPDSSALVITATTNAHVAAFASPSQQLYQVRLSGGEPRQLIQGPFNYTNPSFSHDGLNLCFITSSVGSNVYYALKRLAVAAWPWDGRVSSLTDSLDRSVLSYTFSADSKRALLTAEDGGRIRAWSVPLNRHSNPERISGPDEGVWLSLRAASKGRKSTLFGLWETAHRPAEVFKFDPSTGQRTQLTFFNRSALESMDLPPLREFWMTNSLGRPMHSYLALPPGFDPSKRYPLFVLIHGGHASMWRDSVTRRWNYHLLAQPGYVVLLTDYRGSTGYGQQFTLDILGDPLKGPAEDLNAAADEAIRRFPFIDASRQAAGGASYGGHLANWLEASTTRYRCLISHAGLASLFSQWATSDSIQHREVMMGGPFWANPKAWLDQSPSSYAHRFKTPMLVSIGETDYRVPLNNSVEMWSLLQRQQVPSRLLVWPDENHWILNGENSRVFYKEVHAWLARWL